MWQIILYSGLLLVVHLDQSQTSQHEKVYSSGFDRVYLRELFWRTLLPYVWKAFRRKTLHIQNKETKIIPGNLDVRLSSFTP